MGWSFILSEPQSAHLGTGCLWRLPTQGRDKTQILDKVLSDPACVSSPTLTLAPPFSPVLLSSLPSAGLHEVDLIATSPLLPDACELHRAGCLPVLLSMASTVFGT